MRIGIDCRHIDQFGMGTYTRGLVHALAELPGDERYVAFVGESARHRVPAGFETVIVNTRMFSLQEQLILPGRIAAARLDLYHAPHYAAPLTSIPVVSTVYDTIPFHYPPTLTRPLGWAYMAATTSYTIRASARVLTISDASKEEIARWFDCEPDRVLVTHCGIDDLFFEPGPAHPGRYFLFAGASAPHKNLKRLVEAFATVRGRNPSVELVMVGKVPEYLRGVDGIVLRGRVMLEELAALYRGAIATVFPSLMEGFGLPPLESMAAGTPAVVSNIRPLTDLIGPDAVYVDPWSPPSIASGMTQLIEDPELREALAVRGPARARRFTWRRCAELTREAYRAVISESPRR